MIRYELKKIFGTTGGKIALILYLATVILSCFLSISGFMTVDVTWTNEQGEQEYGFHAVQKLRESRNDWEGWLDEELLNRVIQENLRINATPEGQSSDIRQSNIAYGWKQGFSPIRDLINRSYSDGFRIYDYYKADEISVIREDTFYENRIRQLREWLYDKNDAALDLYSEEEKQYLIGQYEKLETPFYVDYHDGWYQLLENASFLPMLGILITAYMTAGIFSNEFKWKTDAVYFTTLFGKNKATSAKIQAGFCLVSILYWISMLIYSAVTLGYLGFEGAGCVVQLRAWKSIYNITMWQAWVLTLICGYIGSLFLTALTMFISAKTRSSVIAVTTPFVILFLPSILQGMSDWLDMVLSLMPVNLLEFYQHLRTFQLITVFGRVYRVLDVCIPLYAVLTLVLVPIIYRQFRKN